MTFRARLVIAFLVVVLVPLAGLALVVHRQMTDRLTAQYERRVDAMAGMIAGDLSEQRNSIAAALDQVRDAVSDDNRFRKAAVDEDTSERRYLLDYAGGAQRLTGLSMLQIQDASGRILSSGHFRNDYDRVDPELPRLLAAAPHRTALVRVRTAGAPMLVLASVDSVEIGRKRFTVVGGVDVEARFLRRLSGDDAMRVLLVTPDDSLGTPPTAVAARDGIVRELPVPYAEVANGTLGSAQFRIVHGLDELHAVRARIDRWFAGVLAATVLLAVLLSGWVASRVSRPIADLADRASRIDLDRLDVDFSTERRDEVGVLARGLGAMTSRLRESAARLREAERRAATGELARQVNHDIKNGLTPIRHVFRHLEGELDSRPSSLADVFRERRAALDSSISYLENLAANYARIARRGERQRVDLNDVVRRAADDRRAATNARITMDLSEAADVVGDPLSLRRIVENLLDNAIDSLDGREGEVTLATCAASGDDGTRVRLTVADTGPGMSQTQQARIFDDFYTTKAHGTGLGLSIVRRLVMDADGTVRVESEEGAGSRFIVEMPQAGPPAPGGEG